ncbi:hypothetical protein AK812_SmicGene11166 [Symbiodinium microadriaticum]|uniref:Uncharacterized protein n=1 Tax=Symbiodinium microadriaticum TaxID=2951 RepID=A0A1Q9EDY5_SYMMI|nr:hypothetical protein AK812_SmicGene11166 [Symbiodinium microadriaticum]
MFDVVRIACNPPGKDLEEPLCFAIFYFQAYAGAIDLLRRYLTYSEDSLVRNTFHWSNVLRPDLGMTVKEFIRNVVAKFHEPQSLGGLQLMQDCIPLVWNQLYVEQGYISECMKKRDAAKQWRTIIDDITLKRPEERPKALMPGAIWWWSHNRNVQHHMCTELLCIPDTTDGWDDLTSSQSSQATRPEAAGNRSGQAAASSSAPPTMEPEQERNGECDWAEVPIPDGAVEYAFEFHKENLQLCKGRLINALGDPDNFLVSYDERVVVYLGRLQSVTQNKTGGLNVQIFAKADTTRWLQVYAGGCGIGTCEHLPTPAMLTAAALVKNEEDLKVDRNDSFESSSDDDQRERTTVLLAAKELRDHLAFGGKPDATTVRTQQTFLAMDFEIYANNKKATFSLSEAFHHKGWRHLTILSPEPHHEIKFDNTIKVLNLLKQKVLALSEDHRATTTIHIHLCLQAVVYENLNIPGSTESVAALGNMEETLKRVYVDNIKEVIALIPRPPIVMINHDPRFYACAHQTLKRRSEGFQGYAHACSYVATELQLRGCVVVHGSSFWCKMVSSLMQAHHGTHVLSTDQVGPNDPHHHQYRAFAIYEKQLFYEKMIGACYVNPEVLQKCQILLHAKAIEIPRFKKIWSDRTKLNFSSTADSEAWISSERRQAMERETQRDTSERRPGRMWQDFQMILPFPEPIYCPEQYWFKMDEYSVQKLADTGKHGKVFFCPKCEEEKKEVVFCRAQTTFSTERAFPSQCVGCAYKHAHHTTHCKVQNYAELREQERYALACAYYIYTNNLIDIQPVDDLMEYVRRCCPIAYTQVGKVVSSYGGSRYPAGQALSFPVWNKAKQLTWDRAYDEEGNLCFIAYYDAGNSAYAGFLKTLLSPQERVELFRASENPLEVLLGDVFEIALGMLTVALRFPGLFSRWRDVDDINACINGLETCYSRYAAKDSMMLFNSGYPRKRKPAKADLNIEQQVQEILHALPEGSFTAVPTSAELQPPSGVTIAEARSSDDNLFDTSQGVEVPRLIPDEVTEPSGQPDEEDQIPEQRSYRDIADIVKAKTWDSLKVLFNGEIWVDESTVGKICILCGSPHHVFANCKVVNPLRQQIADVFEHIKEAVTVHPDTIVFQPGTAPAPQPPSGEREHNSVILHGTRYFVPDILENLTEEHKMMQRKLSGIFRRTYDITLDERTNPFLWISGAKIRSQPSNAIEAHYRQRLMVNVFPNAEPANMMDPHTDYAKYMAYIIIVLIYKSWSTYSKWFELPVKAAHDAFNRGQRHDSLGQWQGYNQIDDHTGLPRELTDDEVLQCGMARRDKEDPDGTHALCRYRTNQILSTMVRGAIQLGYKRHHFLVNTHVHEGTEVDTKMVHSSCATLLATIVGKATHFSIFLAAACYHLDRCPSGKRPPLASSFFQHWRCREAQGAGLVTEQWQVGAGGQGFSKAVTYAISVFFALRSMRLALRGFCLDVTLYGFQACGK